MPSGRGGRGGGCGPLQAETRVRGRGPCPRPPPWPWTLGGSPATWDVGQRGSPRALPRLSPARGGFRLGLGLGLGPGLDAEQEPRGCLDPATDSRARSLAPPCTGVSPGQSTLEETSGPVESGCRSHPDPQARAKPAPSARPPHCHRWRRDLVPARQTGLASRRGLCAPACSWFCPEQSVPAPHTLHRGGVPRSGVPSLRVPHGGPNSVHRQLARSSFAANLLLCGVPVYVRARVSGCLSPRPGNRSSSPAARPSVSPVSGPCRLLPDFPAPQPPSPRHCLSARPLLPLGLGGPVHDSLAAP